jgi:hypothetical protein
LSASDPLPRVRRLLMLVLVLGALGTSAELLLIGHYEDRWQLVPLVVFGAGLLALAWHAAAGTTASARALQLSMLALIAAGGAGVALHHGRCQAVLEGGARQGAARSGTGVDGAARARRARDRLRTSSVDQGGVR